MNDFEEYIKQGIYKFAGEIRDYNITKSEWVLNGETVLYAGANDLFVGHSWYFRNALVRANYEDLPHDIHRTDIYLIRFLSNLLTNRQSHEQ
jgi:hypothetical protein